jgi:hypothetical protein
MEDFQEASFQTSRDLLDFASSDHIRQLSHLTLPEVEAVVDLVAQRLPAGNIPAMILDGLVQISARKTPLQKVRSDISALFQGVEQMLDTAVYAAFFAGPAAVIWGYQQLLRLAGKRPEDAFPEGTWQFYVDYALREDTAHHTNETHGFDTFLQRHHLRLNEIERLTAWVMTAIHILHQYNDLLKNEWRERVYLHLLTEVTQGEPNAQYYAGLYRQWEKQRPYARPLESQQSYSDYRHQVFNDFLDKTTAKLPDDLTRLWRERIRVAQAILLPHYQRQMSILAYLQPDVYGETRIPLPLENLQIGLVYRGHYYLIPACKPTTTLPADLMTVWGQIAAIITSPSDKPPVSLTDLVRVKRSQLPRLRSVLSQNLVKELNILRLAPIIINANPRPRQLPLAELRQTERGIGDHAITIFDTSKTFVFDQSHIFFDGTWGAALAEIITNEAIQWAYQISRLAPPPPAEKRPYRSRLVISHADQQRIQAAAKATSEATAETDAINLNAIQILRRRLKQRNNLIDLTVNDLLILFRAIHAAIYVPSPFLLKEIDRLPPHLAQPIKTALTSEKAVDPALLIPVDASQQSPRDRVYPMSFVVPLADLELMELHWQTLESLTAYGHAKDDPTKRYEFEALRRQYLATLAGYGAIIQRAKAIATSNEGVSANIVKLLAYLPTSVQQILHSIPDRFDVLNDLIKGREVFSNIGAVVPGSSLTRFITAKDDNDKKTLAWGIITDSEGIMRVTLRDFRPHVALLEAAGRKDIATLITQDYLDTYAHGLNAYIRQLRDITEISS